MKTMSYLKERIKHAVRFRNKRGFGVHSPFMFNLILNVIRDKEKQFTYPEALEATNINLQRERKVFRLLSRLVRYLQVKRVVCLGYNANLLVTYMAEVYQTQFFANDLDELAEADFIYIGRKAERIVKDDRRIAEALSGPVKYVVIADIYKDSFNGRIWRQYQDKATVCVDMMWYGLLFFDDKIQKGKYNLII